MDTTRHNMQDNTELKQHYLREEILEIGYNPGHFASYLCNERDDGDDIDNWSLESLIDIVKQYKLDNPDPDAEKGSEYEISDQSIDEESSDTQGQTQ